MSKSKVSVVKAYAPGPAIVKDSPHVLKSWIVPCPHCGDVHTHGAGEGRRAPHCPHGPDWLTDGWERPSGYTLEYAGVIDDPTIFKAAQKRRKDNYRAYLKAFDDRRKAREREYSIAWRAISKGKAEATC